MNSVEGGVAPLAIAQIAIVAAQALFTPGAPQVDQSLYNDPNIKNLANVGTMSTDMAISVAAGSAMKNTGKKQPSTSEITSAANSLMRNRNRGKILYQSKKQFQTQKINPQVPLTQQKSLIQNMAAQSGDFKKAQKAYHEVAVDAVVFGITWPFRVVHKIFGGPSVEEKRQRQIDAINHKQKLAALQRQGRGEENDTPRTTDADMSMAMLILLALFIVFVLGYIITHEEKGLNLGVYIGTI
jgi:hypothetical protein